MEKCRAYYENPRIELIGFIPDDARRVLDVGCSAGAMGAAIKKTKGPGVEVVGIELNPEVAGKAMESLDKVIIGDVEKISLPFEKGYFDCIIYGDSLEHLVDPWGVVARHVQCLKSGGWVIASIPNIAHYRIIKMLRRKEWSYARSGILDENHLRFFTINSIKEMFGRSGLEIRKVERIIGASKVKKALNRLFNNFFVDDITEQYLIAAVKV